jgi:phage terminase small subunit
MSPRRAAGTANSNASRPRKARAAKDRAPAAASSSEIGENAARRGITVERVLREYARIAFADMRQVLTWGPEGVVLKPPDGLGDAAAAAICEIAPGARPGTIRVKFYDKKAALDAIARHLGMFPAAPRRREGTPAADTAEDAREVLARRLARLAAAENEG